MRKIYSLILAASVTAAFSSCTHEEIDNYIPEGAVRFKAEIGIEDEAGSKAALGTNAEGRPQTMWTPGDKITIHNGDSAFDFVADLEGTSSQADFVYAGDDFTVDNGVIAVYPDAKKFKADLEAKTAEITIPAEQVAVVGSYDPAAAVAVAYSTDDHLRFRNATALLKFTIATEGVKGVVFQGLDGEAVAGGALVTFAEDDGSVASVASLEEGAGTTATVVADEYFKVGEAYYMAVLPQTFSKGFTLGLQFVEDGPVHVTTTYGQARTIRRNVILNMGSQEFDLYSGLDENASPVLTDFRFEVDDNQGKILPGQVKNGTSYDADARTAEVCDIEGNVVSKMIPYLNNRNLVPSFTIPEGTRMIYDGGIIESGKTEVDFLKYKTVKVTNGKDEVEYTINLTNTGLPVIVVNQVSGTTDTYESGSTGNGFRDWYKLTGTKWQPKDSDWEMADDGSDNFMAYYADGSPAVLDKNGALVEEPVMASTRVRGNVSQKMPKKPFAVKLDSKSGVLGMPAHKRWVLLANWSDRTLMRNAIAFETAKYFKSQFPNDGLLWNPSGQFVELVYNGVHVGNYYLCEQIKIDENRLDIAEPYELPKPGKPDKYNGMPESYGYLLECDDAYDETTKFTTKHYIPFMFKDDADAGGKMLEYARNLVCGVEDKLCAGNYSDAYNTLDITSMVDYLLINEVMMNGEIWHPKSAYMYINNDKLYAGPIWDFDWETIPNIDKLKASYDDSYTSEDYIFTYDASMIASAAPITTGSWFWETTTYYLFHSTSSALPSAPLDGSDRNFLWYPMLVKDPIFAAEAASRWSAVHTGLLTHILKFIDETAAKISASEKLNSAMWPVGTSTSGRWSTYDVGGGWKGDEQETFEGAVDLLKTNYKKRANGMSGYITAKGDKWPKLDYQNK